MEKLIRTKKDLVDLESRLQQTAVFEPKKFMLTELLPLLATWLDASVEDSQSNQEAIAALIENNEEMLSEETATQLCIVLELGIQVANAFLSRGQMDEIKEASAKKMAKEYIANAQNAMGLLAQLTLGSSENEEDDDSPADDLINNPLNIEALINGSSKVEEKEGDSTENIEGIENSTESSE
jgi:hypothetical protein